jgi:hypothetical protein
MARIGGYFDMSYNPGSTGTKLSLSGSTSGTISQFANATTASYQIIWPAAQAAGPGYVLTNDGSGNLTWAPSGASSGYYVNLFTLSPTDIANQYVTLSSTPDTPGDTILNVIGGIAQNYGVDFTVSGTQLAFIGDIAAGGNAALVSGDRLIVQYN